MSNDEYYGGLFAGGTDICARKHGGNQESIAAHKTVSNVKQIQRRIILETIRLTHSTCEEIEDATGLSHQSCSARISELKRDGIIQKIGTRETRSGSQAAVYKITGGR